LATPNRKIRIEFKVEVTDDSGKEIDTALRIESYSPATDNDDEIKANVRAAVMHVAEGVVGAVYDAYEEQMWRALEAALEGSPCVACGGSGVSSTGKTCVPCRGTGEQK